MPREELSIGGVRTSLAREGGSGPTVVLLHGLGAHGFTWRGLVPLLSKRCRVVVPDFPGFGRSDKPAAFDYSLTGLSRWLLELLDALGLESPALVGNSMGGVVALMTALSRPERVSRLGLIGTPVYPENIPRLLWPMRYPVLGAVYELLLGPALVRFVGRTAYYDPAFFTDDIVAEYAAPLREKAARRALAAFLRNAMPEDAARWVSLYPSLRAPTLFVRGESDGVVDLESARRFCAAAPNARLLALERCGHAPHEERPDLVAEALQPFLAS